MEKRIIATHYPLKFIDLAGKKVPIFYIPKDNIDQFRLHECLNYLHLPNTNQVVKINEETKLGDILGRTTDLYIARTYPDKNWELLSTEQINLIYLNTGTVWDFTDDNEFNKVFKEERARRQEMKEKVADIREGFVRPSLLYRFKDGSTFDLFAEGTATLLGSLNNPTYIKTIFDEMNAFLMDPSRESYSNEPFKDFIEVEALGKGTSLARDTFLSFSAGRVEHFIDTEVSVLVLSDNRCFLSVFDEVNPKDNFGYRFYALTSGNNLDNFFKLFSFVSEQQFKED